MSGVAVWREALSVLFPRGIGLMGGAFIQEARAMAGVGGGLLRGHKTQSAAGGEKIDVTFIEREGEEITVRATIGESILEAAHKNDVELEGACEGSIACSTCHVIVEDEAHFDSLPEPTDDEDDMLDLAFGLTETSRLGCQVIASKDIDGTRLRIPAATRNFAVDGFKPKPH